MEFIIWLIVGGIAGWIAGLIVQGSGFGIIGDIVIGIVGGFIGGWLLSRVGFPIIGSAVISQLVEAVIGAVILLLIIKLIRRAV